jgi:hypothetical protein
MNLITCLNTPGTPSLEKCDYHLIVDSKEGYDNNNKAQDIFENIYQDNNTKLVTFKRRRR